jgi:hypothetical protein
MNKGISISVERWDEDFIIFVFSASNGNFCAEAELYLERKALEPLEPLAHDLSGFQEMLRSNESLISALSRSSTPAVEFN